MISPQITVIKRRLHSIHLPAPRVTRALEKARSWLAPLAQHLAASGPDPESLPDRDFEAGDWRCNACPFLAVCRPGDSDPEVQVVQETEVTEEEAHTAVTAYTEAQEAIRDPERAKRAALETLKAWMLGKNNGKESIGGRTVRRQPSAPERPARSRDTGGGSHGTHVGARAGRLAAPIPGAPDGVVTTAPLCFDEVRMDAPQDTSGR